ncbi:MAG: PKD domain-containing protein [Candidatus Thermoplasmatota archaeon]|jgi:hypothetical protein|nr:PKD domain-containing protein [Candidatus Thermoplasmatota archaeon]
MKRLGIVLFVSCFLLLSNATIAIGAIPVPVSKISIKNQPTTTTIENIDKPLIEETATIDSIKENEITNTEKVIEPPIETNNEQQIVSKNEEFIVKINEQIIPGQQQAFLYKANAGGPYLGYAGQPIQFSGKSQYQLFNGNGVTYSWDFENDGIYDWSSTYNGVTTHIYNKPGKYLATFKVTKNDKTYIDMAPVDVGIVGADITNSHLKPYGGCCYYGTVGKPILFDASQSTSTGYPIKTYKWYFGDGTIGYGKKVYHTYNESIPYLVQLEITDTAGNKRIDVLHADIDCKLSAYDDFLTTSNQVIQDILSYIKDFIQNRLYFYLLNVKIKTIHNGYETTTDVPNGYVLPQIDVDNDGDYDIQITDISFFAFENPTPSDFTGLSTYSWKSSFSAKVIPRPPGYEGIKQSDNFTILLQFTFGSIITSILGIEEPVIQIGYTSKAGEEKASEFTISHRFRPYILERLGLSGNSQNNQNEEYNEYNQNMNEQTIYYTTTNTQTGPTQQTQTYNNYEPSPQPIENTPVIESESEQTLQMQATQQTINPYPLGDEIDLYPEQEVNFADVDVEKFSLVIACANSNNPSYPNYIRTELQLSFDQFVDSTLKSKRFYDVGFNGYQQSGDASLTLTISRQKNGRKATLGLIIDPIQNFITHVDYTKNADGVCTLSFNIDNPPENLVLFAESEDSWGEYKSNYFYLENIPSSLTFSILPKLENGYISVTKEGSSEFKVGIKNDLKEPSVNLYITRRSLHETRIEWQLLSQPHHSIKLKSTTTGLGLNAEIKDLTQQDQNIEFHGTLQNDLEVEIEWSFIDGYLAVRKSKTVIDFYFSYTKNDIKLMVEGSYTGEAGTGLTIDFDRFGEKGIIEIDTGKAIFLHVSGKKSTATLRTDIDFSTNGHMKLEWDQSTFLSFDATQSLTFRNLDFNAPDFAITADSILFASSSSFKLDLTGNNRLQIGGNNQITLSNIELTTKQWRGAIGYAKSVGSFNINLQPDIKYYSLNMNQLLILENFNLIFDSYNSQYDTDFGVEDLNLINSGIVWFDFNSLPLKFEMSTQYQTSTLSFENLHLAIGPQNSRTIDFTISSFNVNSGGIIHSEFNSQHFYVAANIAFNWNIDVTTLSYGNWKINGTYSGSGTMDITEWQPGVRGQVAIGVVTPIHHNLKIIHGQLELELGNMTLNQGSSNIKWKREQPNSNGYFNITSNVLGSLTLCKLTYNDSQNPVEFSIENIQIQPVKLNFSWQKQSDTKMLHINNNHTINMALIKLKWSDKTLTVGNIGLKPGQFNIVYDSANKIITLNNGMNAFGPLCTYEDTNRKLSIDLLNLVNDYSKTMTLKWYEDSNNKIIGVYLDTDDTQLVDWITFTSIRYGSTPTGRRIALSGFKADDFKIMKNVNDKIEITGKLYIANHITYSRLVNLQTDQWEDLDIEWDLQSDLKMIKFESEFDLTIKLISFEIGGLTFTSDLDLTDYMEVKWKLAGGPTVQKEFYFDTNGQTISSLSFTLLGPDNRGIEIVGGGVYAENFYVKWKLWPPSQADIQWGGTIGYDTATVYGTQDGTTWIEIWPFASGSQHTTG